MVIGSGIKLSGSITVWVATPSLPGRLNYPTYQFDPRRLNEGCFHSTPPPNTYTKYNSIKCIQVYKTDWKTVWCNGPSGPHPRGHVFLTRNKKCGVCSISCRGGILWPVGLYGIGYKKNIASCAIWLWSLVSYIKGGTQVKGISKQDPEANIWTQEGLKWGVEKAPQWRTS